MRLPSVSGWRAWLAGVLIAGALAPARGATPEAFALRDTIGRTWRNEVVRFDASPAQLAQAQAGAPLVGPDGKPVLYQIVGDPGANASIAFLADLDPFEERHYRFAADAAPAATTDLTLDENGNVLRIGNGHIGLALRKTLRDGEGPIESIRLSSGRTIGNSILVNAPPAQSYAVTVTARGPVFIEVSCVVGFGGGRTWRLRFRIEADEPAVLVDETFDHIDAAAFQLLLSPNFTPDTLFYRSGKPSHGVGEGRLSTWGIPANYDATAFVLEPWLHWNQRDRQGTWFGLYRTDGSDLLAFAARAAARWVDPAKPEQRATAQTFLTSDRAGLKWTLPLRGGERAWMIEALDKTASLAPLAGKDLVKAPLPQQIQIKHADFPLDRVKDFVSQWPGDVESDHPRLALTRRELPAACANGELDPKRLSQLRQEPVSPYRMDEAVRYYLCGGDPALGRHLAMAAVAMTQDAVNGLIQQNRLVTLGYAPHIQVATMTAVYLADAVWSSDQLSPEMRARIKAQLVFLAYTVDRDDYWSPERGFSANPSMTTTVASFRALFACMFPTHPQAPVWARRGLGELKRQLHAWADDNGGWLEAPHYASLPLDYLLGVFVAARNAGFGDFLYDPKLKKYAAWFAKIATPPDAAADGHRHLPPIGNTYIREPNGQYAIVASLWKQKDPHFAATMQWMFRQQGSPPSTHIGGFNPAFAGYRQLLVDPTIVPQAPAYASELFPRTGAMLRAHFPSDRETQLYLIAGANHEHYDMDSGSFTLWGKGRVIADDFGYEGYMPAEDHNMVESARAPGRALMQVTAFTADANLDYVRGVKSAAWTRQIAFVKDADALGPNYFVVADSLAKAEPATWRLWLTAAAVNVEGRRARVVGKDDVDTDIVFLNDSVPRLATERKTRETWGMTGGRFDRASSTQTGLIARGGAFTALIYPRLKSEPPPTVTPLAGGKAVKVESGQGTDYVFLGAAPFAYRDKDIAFSGTAGLVRLRHGAATLALGAAGTLSAFGKSLTRD